MQKETFMWTTESICSAMRYRYSLLDVMLKLNGNNDWSPLNTTSSSSSRSNNNGTRKVKILVKKQHIRFLYFYHARFDFRLWCKSAGKIVCLWFNEACTTLSMGKYINAHCALFVSIFSLWTAIQKQYTLNTIEVNKIEKIEIHVVALRSDVSSQRDGLTQVS